LSFKISAYLSCRFLITNINATPEIARIIPRLSIHKLSVMRYAIKNIKAANRDDPVVTMIDFYKFS
jgi:hypothetical protein